MRYTRYNYKKKKNNDILKVILSFVSMSIFVIIVGGVLANIIIYFLPLNNADTADASKRVEEVKKETSNDESVNEKNKKENSKENVEATDNKTQENINKFIAIQCGYFSKEDNAKEVFSKVSNEFGAFIYNDADKFKVLAGIYEENNAQAIIDKLKSNSIDCAKVEFEFNTKSDVENQISGICSGYLKILDAAFKDDVKYFDTTDFKKWVSELNDIKKGENNEVLSDLKKHINELNKEIKKEDIKNEIEYLYKILLNFKK